ncbi:hypothetical protein F0562_031838 [Nyssa sinensis]|uniref:Uncharacterized protein n=1 Tax=Nyssa sinensis TaxID=561372 RepID=A0A5J5ATC9_9ASTE|nr:hypothetical protein F0562_031838 [Nyssa sinensis]
MVVNDYTNGDRSDTEDACVLKTGSIECDDKSGSKMDEGLPSADLNINKESDDHLGTMNLQTDLKRSEENSGTGQCACKDPELRSEDMVTGDSQVQGKPELDLDGNCNKENGVDSKSVTVEAHKDVVLSCGTEAGKGQATGDLLGESIAVEEQKDCVPSTLGAEVVTTDVVEVSAKRLRTELEGQQVVPENNLNSKQDGNSDAKMSGQSGLNCAIPDSETIGYTSHLAADTDSSSGFGVIPKHQHEIDQELDPTQEPGVISLHQDNLAASANSVPQHYAAIQSEKILDQDIPSTFDFDEIRDKQLKKSASANNNHQHLSEHSSSDCFESSQILRGIPIRKEMSRDVSCKKLGSLQSFSKSDRNFHSDGYLSKDCFLQKCNSSKAHSSGAELSFMPQEQTRDRLRSHSRSLSDVEKPCRKGDVKLFGQILTHPTNQRKLNSMSHENEDEGVHPKLSCKSFNLKFTGTHSIDGNFVPGKLDRSNYLGFDNLPVKSYGFWDGNRIQTGFSSLPDSAILLAKYPAAFSNYSTPSSKVEQQPLQSVAKGNEYNLNGVSVLPPREISSSNTYRSRDGTKVQPLAVNLKQRQEMLFSEMQRRNGFEAVSSIQQQGRGMVGINVGGRRGILVGGTCTDVSDPVAAIKMHYCKAEQFSSQAGSIIREEESWRDISFAAASRGHPALQEMDLFFGGLTEESQPSQQDIIRCPFLRNINEPTNFSFSSSMTFPMPVCGAKGPIFEDGPNFDMAFRLFHGQNGVVPLSRRSFSCSEKSEAEPAPPRFNPLAAKAATISFSAFGPAGPFGFNAFSEKWKKINKKSKSSKKEHSSQGGDSKHEAMSNEWLETGNCPIAKSFRAVSHIIPLVAKTLQPPPGMKFKCPQAIVAARAALSRTAFAKNLRPQPLPAKILAIGVLGMAANIPLGIWREHTQKFSPSWFAAVHAAVPFIAMLRKSILMPKTAMAFTIAASVLGQVIGSRAERFRLKAVAARRLALPETSENGSSQIQVGLKGGHCSGIAEWNTVPLQIAGPSSTADVFC